MAMNSPLNSIAMKPASPAKGVNDVRWTAMPNRNMPRGTGYGSVSLGATGSGGGGGFDASMQMNGLGSYLSQMAAYKAAMAERQAQQQQEAERERMMLAAELEANARKESWQKEAQDKMAADAEKTGAEVRMGNINSYFSNVAPTSFRPTYGVAGMNRDIRRGW